MPLINVTNAILPEKQLDHSSSKIAIMQPYFLPYLGYFSLIKAVDKWIVMDEVQMIQYGWVHRNRVLKQDGGFYYIRVPLVKHSHTTLIKDIRINNETDWKQKIIDQLGHYKRKAPFYRNTIGLLKSAFEKSFESLTQQNVHLLEKVCEYLEIDFSYTIQSDLKVDASTISESDDSAKCICHTLGYQHCVNPIGGRDLYCTEEYEQEGIDLCFLKNNLPPYEQKNGSFVKSLSIVDVMMFNSPEEINKMLDSVKVIR